MTAHAEEEGLLTVDQLAAVTGMTVRTTRYYAGLGLLPPPIRRGRMAYYAAEHRARLELIRALQDHGFTLSAIDRYLARLPIDASVEDLAIQRVMLTSWQSGPLEVVTRRELDVRAGRPVDDEMLAKLEATSAVRREGDRFALLPGFEVSTQLLDLDIPVESLVEADAAITRHMDALADELTVILRNRVLAPYRKQPRTEAEKTRFEHTMTRLRQLTMEAVVSGFQRAANQVIGRSLSKGDE
jgi:DNA-binding transcriptional MerR regulator